MRNLFILRGAPGSGKSTWIEQNNLESYTLSADKIRLMYQSPVTNLDGTRAISQNNDTAVWELLFQLLEKRMEKGEFVCIDATHYKSTLINRYNDLVDKYRYRVNVVDFSNVSEEELHKRNEARDEFKRVPREVIDKMLVALKDTNELNERYKKNMLTPEQASDILKKPLEVLNLDEFGYEKVVIFGDIHGCYEPLKTYFEQNPFNENTCYIFVGDYIDRGLQNKEVLEFLLTIYDKKNVVLLEGNHERWLRMYSEKDYNINEYRKDYIYHDICLKKILAQLNFKQAILTKKINVNNNEITTLQARFKEERLVNPEAKTIFYNFEEVNVRDRIIQLDKEIKDNQKLLERLNIYITGLKWETGNTRNGLEIICRWYKDTFNENLSYDIISLLEKEYPVKANKHDNPIKSPEFLKRTLPQIEDIDKAQLRQLCRKFSQLSYFQFKNKKFLVTHAGVPCMPDIFTPTEEIIKGVGKYEQHEEVDRIFAENTKGQNIIQIHGHRNTMKSPIKMKIAETGSVFNLCSEIEYGEPLRVVEFTWMSNFPVPGVGSIHNNNLEIPNTVFTPKEEPKTETKSQLELLKEMTTSKWIQVKNLNKDVISLNFTREAFEKDRWNPTTCTARGLFVNKKNGDVVARSYSKFHNYNQIKGLTDAAGLKQNLKFPVIGYKKENGFLGLVSKYKGELYFFTKSSDSGDYVNWFIGALCDNYGIYKPESDCKVMSYSCLYNLTQKAKDKLNDCLNESIVQYHQHLLSCLTTMKQRLIDKLQPIIEEGFTYIFECVDPQNDPHIIKYNKSKVFLLDAVENTIEEENFKPYDKLCFVAECLGVPVKQQELIFNSWEEFEEWKNTFRHGTSQWDCKHEGYVFCDANNFRVKFKSTFYNWWKQMRTVKEIIQKGGTNKKIYKTKEEIQAVKLMESIPKEELKKMSIIDVAERFYKEYEA